MSIHTLDWQSVSGAVCRLRWRRIVQLGAVSISRVVCSMKPFSVCQLTRLNPGAGTAIGTGRGKGLTAGHAEHVVVVLLRELGAFGMCWSPVWVRAF